MILVGVVIAASVLCQLGLCSVIGRTLKDEGEEWNLPGGGASAHWLLLQDDPSSGQSVRLLLTITTSPTER